MDLQLALRVVWRFKYLVGAGLALAFVLAFLSMVDVKVQGSPHFAYKTHPQYESLTTVFVTTHGFPWGSLKLSAGPKDPQAPRGSVDTSQLRDFTSIYLQLAASDPVRRLMLRSGPIDGVIQAFPVFSPDSSTLPLMNLSAIASTPTAARQLAARHLSAFRAYLQQQQQEVGTPADDRVVLEAVNGPQPAHLLQGRKKTKAIMIFLAVTVAVLALSFILENLRPRARPIGTDELAREQLSGAQITRPAA
jgi:hypothetical protein